MEVIVKTGAIERHQMMKEVGQPHAVSQMKKMADSERAKSTDDWWKKRFDWGEAAKNAMKLKKNLEKVIPETLTPAAKDMMWRRAKALKDEFVVGMLSYEELHPVKGFSENGRMVWVVDEGRINANRAVERNTAWYQKNAAKIREFKAIMRHLCPQNPRAGDIERFRPKKRGIR